MIIFPLSIPAKIVLVLIAVMLGLIFYGMCKPEFLKKLFRKRQEAKAAKLEQPTKAPTSPPPKV